MERWRRPTRPACPPGACPAWERSGHSEGRQQPSRDQDRVWSSPCRLSLGWVTPGLLHQKPVDL
eukprot:7401063-Alexandrium_andersonii.AAC.1